MTAAPPPALTGVSLNPATVVAGGSVQGTVAFSGSVSSAATVALSVNPGTMMIPGTVTVPAASSSATFTIATLLTQPAGQFTVTATYNAVAVTAILTVMPVVIKADFTVIATTSTVNAGQCSVEPNGGVNTVKCKLDASISTPNPGITKYEWGMPDGRQITSTTPVLDGFILMCGGSVGASARKVTLTITAPGGTHSITKDVTFVKDSKAC